MHVHLQGQQWQKKNAWQDICMWKVIFTVFYFSFYLAIIFLLFQISALALHEQHSFGFIISLKWRTNKWVFPFPYKIVFISDIYRFNFIETFSCYATSSFSFFSKSQFYFLITSRQQFHFISNFHLNIYTQIDNRSFIFNKLPSSRFRC